jgi:hypothetical protein
MVSRRYQEKDFDQLSFVMAGHDGDGKEKPRQKKSPGLAAGA